MGRPRAVILAGGLGSRLGGVRKATLRVGNRRLLDLVSERLGDGIERPILVASGPERWPVEPDGFCVVQDDRAGHAGPLAGVLAAAAALRRLGMQEGVLITAAADAPFLPDDYVERLLAALAGKAAAHAVWRENFYPTHAAWRIEMLPDAASLGSPLPGPRALLDGMFSVPVDWSGSHDRNPFAGINTLDHLLSAQGRMGR
jgi:molybdopterin-guanine dinucleotide biosynthesis protein A